MHSEMIRPDLPDTPDLFARIEAGLRDEAATIRARHATRLRRVRWYEGLRPVLSVAAAAMTVVVVVPLGHPGAPPAATPPESRSTVDAPDSIGAATPRSFRHRLPDDDLAAIVAAATTDPRPTPATNMTTVTPA